MDFGDMFGQENLIIHEAAVSNVQLLDPALLEGLYHSMPDKNVLLLYSPTFKIQEQKLEDNHMVLGKTSEVEVWLANFIVAGEIEHGFAGTLFSGSINNEEHLKRFNLEERLKKIMPCNSQTIEGLDLLKMRVYSRKLKVASGDVIGIRDKVYWKVNVNSRTNGLLITDRVWGKPPQKVIGYFESAPFWMTSAGRTVICYEACKPRMRVLEEGALVSSDYTLAASGRDAINGCKPCYEIISDSNLFYAYNKSDPEQGLVSFNMRCAPKKVVGSEGLNPALHINSKDTIFIVSGPSAKNIIAIRDGRIIGDMSVSGEIVKLFGANNENIFAGVRYSDRGDYLSLVTYKYVPQSKLYH